MDLSMPGYVPDGSEAGAGLTGDQVLGATVTTESTVQAAYDTGAVSKARLEDMVVRIMTQYFREGYSCLVLCVLEVDTLAGFGQDFGYPAVSLTDDSVDVQVCATLLPHLAT